jgi:transposase
MDKGPALEKKAPELPPPWRTPNVRRREASIGRTPLCQCAIHEFRQRAVELARTGHQPVAKLAADLGIATSCLRRWMKQDDIDGGRWAGLDTDERAELVRLRRELRTAQMEVEILRRAAAYFAKET